MDWNQILSDSGLSEREVSVVNVLAGKPSMKASEVAKELGVTRLDAYKALEDLQEKGMVSISRRLQTQIEIIIGACPHVFL